VSSPAGLTFPTDYPLKVVGRPGAGFRQRIDAIVLQHAPTLTPERVTERPSANGNFLSITYLLHAESRSQIEALVAELTACEGVLMLL
jgi:uncharacterized protein